MSTVKAHGGRPRGEPGEVGQPPLEQTWTTIAADSDGEVLEHEIGKRHTTRRAAFAYREEAEAWIFEQMAEGWVLVSGPTPLATFRYHGPTDSGSNAWSVEVSREKPPRAPLTLPDSASTVRVEFPTRRGDR